MKAKSKPLEASLHRWSIEAGIDDATLAKYLHHADVKVVAGAMLQARDVVRAICGDDKVERTRLVRSQRELNEIEKAEKEKTLVPRTELEAELWSSVLLPFRTDLLALCKKHGLESEIAALMEKHFHNKPKTKTKK